MREKTAVMVEKQHADVDEEHDSDLRQMVKEYGADAKAMYPEGSFQRLFRNSKQGFSCKI